MPGYSSEISIPDCPYRENQGLPRIGAFEKSMRLVFVPFAISGEIV